MFDSSWIIGLHIPANLIPGWLLWTGNILFIVVLLLAARQKPLRNLIDNHPSQHAYFGAMAILLLMWGIKAGITPGLGFHHLGATLFTLMFGWPLAIFGLATVLLASMLVQTQEISSLGVNGLLSIVAPVISSYSMLKLSQRFLPDNFFIYIFVVAFFGAGIAVAVSRLLSIVLLSLIGAYPDAKLMEESLLIMPLFMFPEAFITGMLISVFVVYRPSWVLTFDDDRYIKGK